MAGAADWRARSGDGGITQRDRRGRSGAADAADVSGNRRVVSWRITADGARALKWSVLPSTTFVGCGG